MVWFGGQLAGSAWNIKLPSLGITGAIDFAPIVGWVRVQTHGVERRDGVDWWRHGLHY